MGWVLSVYTICSRVVGAGRPVADYLRPGTIFLWGLGMSVSSTLAVRPLGGSSSSGESARCRGRCLVPSTSAGC